MPHSAEHWVEVAFSGKPRSCKHPRGGHFIGSDVEPSAHSSPVKDPAGALKVAESGAEEAMHGGPAKPGCASPEADNSEIIADHARLACAGPNFGQEAEGCVAPPSLGDLGVFDPRKADLGMSQEGAVPLTVGRAPKQRAGPGDPAAADLACPPVKRELEWEDVRDAEDAGRRRGSELGPRGERDHSLQVKPPEDAV